MSCNRKVTAAVIVLTSSGCAVAAPAPVQCPSSLMADGQRHPLLGISVFDGLPEKQVDLQPLTTGTGTKAVDHWVLASLWETGDRQPYAVCDYNGTPQTKVYKIPAGTKSCTNAGDPVRSECR